MKFREILLILSLWLLDVDCCPRAVSSRPVISAAIIFVWRNPPPFHDQELTNHLHSCRTSTTGFRHQNIQSSICKRPSWLFGRGAPKEDGKTTDRGNNNQKQGPSALRKSEVQPKSNKILSATLNSRSFLRKSIGSQHLSSRYLHLTTI